MNPFDFSSFQRPLPELLSIWTASPPGDIPAFIIPTLIDWGIFPVQTIFGASGASSRGVINLLSVSHCMAHASSFLPSVEISQVFANAGIPFSTPSVRSPPFYFFVPEMRYREAFFSWETAGPCRPVSDAARTRSGASLAIFFRISSLCPAPFATQDDQGSTSLNPQTLKSISFPSRLPVFKSSLFLTTSPVF